MLFSCKTQHYKAASLWVSPDPSDNYIVVSVSLGQDAATVRVACCGLQLTRVHPPPPVILISIAISNIQGLQYKERSLDDSGKFLYIKYCNAFLRPSHTGLHPSRYKGFTLWLFMFLELFTIPYLGIILQLVVYTNVCSRKILTVLEPSQDVLYRTKNDYRLSYLLKKITVFQKHFYCLLSHHHRHDSCELSLFCKLLWAKYVNRLCFPHYLIRITAYLNTKSEKNCD